MKALKFLIIIILLIFCNRILAQTVTLQLVSSSGDTYKNTNYQLDWSIGELQTETYPITTNSLTQGFHQDNYTITAIQQVKDSQFEIIVYPNPTTDYIHLKIGSSQFENMLYILTDMNGKTIQTEKITEGNQQINFSNIAIGTYFIIIKQKEQLVKSFKIIKN